MPTFFDPFLAFIYIIFGILSTLVSAAIIDYVADENDESLTNITSKFLALVIFSIIFWPIVILGCSGIGIISYLVGGVDE